MVDEADWRAELDRWLEPFLTELNHAARRSMCPHYIAGLIGLGERKSMQPLAARQDGLSYDRLQHFISVGRWDDAPLARALLAEADRMVGGRDAVLVIDDTSLPKKGRHSVGVAPQYLSTQGKTGNCQALVSLTLARREVPVLVGLRLFLPASWTDDEARLKRAGVPEAMRAPRTKPEIALDEVDRIRGAGTRFGLVLADAGYGCSPTFRAGLSARGLAWAVGAPSNVKVYPADVALLPAEPKPGRPSAFLLPDKVSEPAEAVLGRLKWRPVTWRSGTKGRLKARFAAVRVRVADGPTRRIGGKNNQHLPGTEEVWLVGEHRTSGERKFYVSNLPPKASLRRLASAIKARWVCEQAHQQVKEELGLDHFEGRSWTGLHRHALMTMLAYAFLQHRRLAQAGRGKKAEGGPATASADPPGRAPGHAGQPGPAPHAMPALRSAPSPRIIELNVPK